MSPAALTHTGRLVLGMLAFGKNTGYEIKQFVDSTTRNFWAASYGQIYPELKRFEDSGLVTSQSEPAGGRQRTVYELTDAGRDELRDWLEEDEEPLFEFRSETLLKLFFSDAVDHEFRVGYLRALREQQERKLSQLRRLEEHARAAADAGTRGPSLTLGFGLAHTQWLIDWCREAETQLSTEA